MGAEITPVIALAFVGLVLMIVLAFVTVVVWAEARRKEREALYRSELLKKLAESPGPGADAVLASLREDEQRRLARRREIVTGGAILSAMMGVAATVVLFVLKDPRESGAWAGSLAWICFAVGILGYARFGMARPAQRP